MQNEMGLYSAAVDTFISPRFYSEQARCLYNNLYMLTTQDIALDGSPGPYKTRTNSIMHLLPGFSASYGGDILMFPPCFRDISPMREQWTRLRKSWRSMRLPYTYPPLHNVEYDYVVPHSVEIHRNHPFPLKKRIVCVFIKCNDHWDSKN